MRRAWLLLRPNAYCLTTWRSRVLRERSEILLRPYQFCNLTEVVVRGSDDADSLRRKVRLATTLGTFQVSGRAGRARLARARVLCRQ